MLLRRGTPNTGQRLKGEDVFAVHANINGVNEIGDGP
jgi:hypothetical protein